jgi:hypothetical protein
MLARIAIIHQRTELLVRVVVDGAYAGARAEVVEVIAECVA